MKRPLIGISVPLKGGLIQNLAIRFSVFICGGRSINMSVNNYLEKCQNLDGLIISGGTDIHPSLYNSSNIKTKYSYDVPRDKMELDLIKLAYKHSKPLFCICRGAQLLNVAKGGTLYEDLSKVYENAEYPTTQLAKIFYRKKIFIEDGSYLNLFLNKSEELVNSMHTQSVNRLGSGLKVTSQEKNGVVQSIENTDGQFVLGVQFHPEFLIFRKNIRSLFRKFIDICKKPKEFKSAEV